MCGIAGLLDFSQCGSEDELLSTVNQMTATLEHRGPDDSGEWASPRDGVALGHRRLSILDLSPLGHQPMLSRSGRYVVVFNGEIYNHQKLRIELENRGHSFRGGSDTEVLLAAIEEWPVQEALQRCAGMFAIAIWDRQDRCLHLARDRMGEKPLYTAWLGDVFVFGSELKALRAHPCWSATIDRSSVATLLQYGYIPSPQSIYEGVEKLMPGTLLTLRPHGERRPQAVPYWSLKEVAENGTAHPFQGSPVEAVDRLDGLLREIVREQSICDVPHGVFLSGGIDSSAIVGLSQAVNNSTTKTFSIGFEDDAFDEAPRARIVAKQLGTDHTEFYVTADEAISVIPRLPAMYDEPLGDPSQIPTFLVSKLAKRHVTVALSGDGGDELFAGYNRYTRGERLWRWWLRMPSLIRHSLGSCLMKVPCGSWNAMLQRMPSAGRIGRTSRWSGEAIHKLGSLLGAGAPTAFYEAMVSQLIRGDTLVHGSLPRATALTDESQWSQIPDFMPQMQYLDAMTYLPDNILAKVDRASMAVSLEVRAPMLDHRCVEFAWTLPANLKVRDGSTKWILRQLLHRYVPQDMFSGPKQGFSIPLAAWLRGPLRNWSESLLDHRRLVAEDILDADQIRTIWRQHLSGTRDWQYLLWNVLSLQAWLDHQKAPTTTPSERIARPCRSARQEVTLS